MKYVCCFFNPCNYKNIVNNFNIFYKNLQKDIKENLIVVEMSFDDDKPYIEQADIHVRGTREKNLVWQKEALLNIGFHHILKNDNASNLGYLDTDLIFLNKNLHYDSQKILEEYDAAQLFSSITYLDENNNLVRNTGSWKCDQFYKIGDRNPGGAWCMRSSCLSSDNNGIYSHGITGSGDVYTIDGFISNEITNMSITKYYTQAMYLHHKMWKRKIVNCGKLKIHYVEGMALHPYHGKLSNRFYVDRHKPLLDHNYNPFTQIKINKEGLLEWVDMGTPLRPIVAEYFSKRKEDGDDGTTIHTGLVYS